MKNNLKEKILNINQKRGKVLTNKNFSNESDNQDTSISLSEIWDEEITRLKSMKFDSLEEVKSYIINIISNKENLSTSQEFNNFANMLLANNPQIDEILKEFVKK